MWIYRSGSDGLPGIVMYEYQPGRSGNYPKHFLEGFQGLLQCDCYQGYNKVEDVLLVCCMAHCRRKFYEALPAERKKDSLQAYLQDGRCELSNNAAERCAKSYAVGRKNSLFHTSVDGANTSAIIYSLVETAKANNLNVFQYIYMLLLYMPGCKNGSEGIEHLLPWSEFMKEHCSGLIDVENVTVEKHLQLPS